MNGTWVTAQPTSLNNTLLWNPHFVLVILIWLFRGRGDCLDTRNQAHRASYLGHQVMFKSFRDNRGKFSGQPGQISGANRGIFPGQTGAYFRGKPGQAEKVHKV